MAKREIKIKICIRNCVFNFFKSRKSSGEMNELSVTLEYTNDSNTSERVGRKASFLKVNGINKAWESAL